MLEPFYSGSHKLWAEGLKKYSTHNITISSLPGRHWKWRMHGAAITFAERHKNDIHHYDLVIATDMCDVATLKGLLKIEVPVIVYFHENQLAYPWSADDKDVGIGRDRRYAWINITTAMAGDHLWFNSAFNRQSFLERLPEFLHAFPDANSYDQESLGSKSSVVPLGLELNDLLITERKSNDIPIILWNHRWEYDKRPEVFFQSLYKLHDEDIDFQLIVLGTHTKKYPNVFDEAKKKLFARIIHFGSVETRNDYISLVQRCDILPVTSIQDFFGISVVEGIAGGVIPLLPEGLAFEEHLPLESYPDLFYKDDDEYHAKLKLLLRSYRNYQLGQHIKSYDWRSMIKNYDNLFREVIE